MPERRFQAEFLFEEDFASGDYRIRSVPGRVCVVGGVRSRGELDRVVRIERSHRDGRDVETYVAVH